MILVVGAFIAFFGVLIAILIAWAQLNVWESRPVLYECSTPAEIERYVRSWGRRLDERGRIVVRHIGSGVEVEFRKHRYRRRPDALLFRYRNLDAGRKYFTDVQHSFESAGVLYDMELTPKQRRPRALTVSLDPLEVFAPTIAVRLVELALRFKEDGSSGGFQMFCQGPMQSKPEDATLELIPWRKDQHVGYRLAKWVGEFLRGRR